jgi:hypothetical protein
VVVLDSLKADERKRSSLILQLLQLLNS